MIKLYFRSIVLAWKIDGFSRNFFLCVLIEFLIRSFVFITLIIDKFIFSAYKKIKVKKPVFIIGHPRSGTTFLHNLLTSDDNSATFKTWHLVFPALTARLLIQPLFNYLTKTYRDDVLPTETGHHMAINKTDEEEMLFLHTFDTQFILLHNLLYLDNREYPELQQHDQQPKAHRLKSMRFIDGCFRRQIYFTGKNQIIAQTHFSTRRLLTMVEFYPDASFVYMVRDPLHVVPSYLSLTYKWIEFRCGKNKIPQPVLNRFYKRQYQSIIELYRYFYDLQKNRKIPQNKVMVLPYHMLLSDLEGAFERIINFTGIKITDKLIDNIRREAKKQKNYRRKHQVMDLAFFNLTEEMIKYDFAFVYEEYGV